MAVVITVFHKDSPLTSQKAQRNEFLLVSPQVEIPEDFQAQESDATGLYWSCGLARRHRTGRHGPLPAADEAYLSSASERWRGRPPSSACAPRVWTYCLEDGPWQLARI